MSSENNKRIAKNTMMLYIRMMLIMLVSLYTSRIVLNILGVEDYGIYNIVGGIVGLFGVINGAMTTATQRYLSFDIGRKDSNSLKKTFNVSQIIHIAIAIVVLIFAETVGVWIIKRYLNVDPGRLDAAIWVYHFSVLTFMVNIIQVPYNSILIARESMSVYAYVSVLEVSMKLLIVFVLDWFNYDHLKVYGVLLFIVTLLNAFVYRIYTYKKFPETRFVLVTRKAEYLALISYSGWNVMGNISAVAKGQGVSLILNLFFGTVVNAAQGIANQIQVAVNSFVTNFQIASNPQIIKSYASNSKDYMIDLVFRTSKFSYYLLLVISLPVLFEIHFILKKWLVIVPEYTANFTVLILINSLIDTISGPLMITLHAVGIIRIYQIVVGSLLVLILPVSYFFLKWGYPPETTYIVSIVFSFIAFGVRIILVKNYLPEFPVIGFFNDVIYPILKVSIFSMILPMMFYFSLNAGLFRMIILILSSLASSLTVIYFMGLNYRERSFVLNSLNKLISFTKR